MKLYHDPDNGTLVVKVAESTMAKAIELLIASRPEWVDNLLYDFEEDEYAAEELRERFESMLMAYAEAVITLNGSPRPTMVLAVANQVDRRDDPEINTPATAGGGA